MSRGIHGERINGLVFPQSIVRTVAAAAAAKAEHLACRPGHWPDRHRRKVAEARRLAESLRKAGERMMRAVGEGRVTG